MLKKAAYSFLRRQRTGERADIARLCVEFPGKPTEKSKKNRPKRQKTRGKSKPPQQFAKVEPACAQDRVQFVPEFAPQTVPNQAVV